MGRTKRERRFGEPVAGNGILSRRIFLERALVAGAAGAGAAWHPARAPSRWRCRPGQAAGHGVCRLRHAVDASRSKVVTAPPANPADAPASAPRARRTNCSTA